MIHAPNTPYAGTGASRNFTTIIDAILFAQHFVFTSHVLNHQKFELSQLSLFFLPLIHPRWCHVLRLKI